MGTPVACRGSVEAEETVGYFVTPLPVRCQVVGSLEALLLQVAAEVRHLLEQPRIALAELCEELNVELRRVLQAMFIFQSCPMWSTQLPSFFMGHEGCELRLGELILESMAIGQQHAQFDLALMMALEGSKLIGSLQYASQHYSRSAVLRLQGQFLRLLQRLTEGLFEDVVELSFVAPEDLRLQRALSPWQHGPLPSTSLAELVARRCGEAPGAFAVVDDRGTATFGDVLRKGELLATALLRSDTAQSREDFRLEVVLEESSLVAEQGHGLVGIMAQGVWMVAGPLGAWMAGRGYFALDAQHPLERIQQMAQDATPQCVLCEKRTLLVANSLGWPLLLVEDLQAFRLHLQRREPWPYLPPEAPALLVFTSGSTGRPKGVVLPSRALLAHVLFSAEHFEFRPGQAVLQHSSWTFDAPICEIWPAILKGATVVLAKRDGSKDFQYISALIDQHRVSHALFVPSLLAEILEQQALPRSLRSLVVVGEACSLNLARRILEVRGQVRLQSMHLLGDARETPTMDLGRCTYYIICIYIMIYDIWY